MDAFKDAFMSALMGAFLDAKGVINGTFKVACADSLKDAFMSAFRVPPWMPSRMPS